MERDAIAGPILRLLALTATGRYVTSDLEIAISEILVLQTPKEKAAEEMFEALEGLLGAINRMAFHQARGGGKSYLTEKILAGNDALAKAKGK